MTKNPRKNAITLLADKTVFSFFGGRNLARFHCLDCCFDSGVGWWTQVLSMIKNLLKQFYVPPARKLVFTLQLRVA